MPTFTYTVRTPTGATQRGQIEAADRRAAALALRQRQLIVTSLRARPRDLAINLPGLTGGVAVKDLVVFTRQFATMISSGLPLVQCLDTLGRQTPNKRLAEIVMQVKADVKAGASFTEALRKQPRVFGDFYVNMAEAGEAGGALDTILTRLAVYLEKARALRGKVRGAMAYPAAIVAVAGLVMALSSGVPILDGLAITARVTGNKVMEDAVLTAIARIKQGSTIAEPLRDQVVFAPMVVQMIEVGENAGALDAMLNKIADFYDDKVNHAVEALTSLLEPLLMVVLGALIGFMLIAMYLPIFEMAGTFG